MNGPPHLLHLDDALIVINKPAALLSVPDGSDRPNARTLCATAHGQALPVHRLDMDTSGVLIFARTPQAQRELSAQFEQALVRKSYIVLAHGCPDWSTRTVSAPLRPGSRGSMRVDAERGKTSATAFARQQCFGTKFSLIQAKPMQGRTHQIRAHLQVLGHPICGDDKYKATRAVPSPIARLALHAEHIEFIHPSSGQLFIISAPLPDDFAAALHRLQQGK